MIASSNGIEPEAAPRSREISGRWVIVGIFVYSATIVGLLWVFAVLDRAPFQQVEHALAEEFPDSRPKVRGGREKGDEDNPMLLRVVLKVPFDPEADEKQASEIADRVLEVAKANHDISKYDELEVDVFHLLPEKDLLQRTFRRKLK